jgi:hypothetical protein
MIISRSTSSAYAINTVPQHRVGLMQKLAKRHTHFCVVGTGISAARTTLLLNAAASSNMNCASALSPLTISHLGESGIHLWQLYVFVFICRVIKTLRTLCLSSCTTCFGRSGHHQVDFTRNVVTDRGVWASRVTAVFFEVQPTRCNVIQYSLLLLMLYMFRAVSPPIIRSSRTVHTASVTCPGCLLLLLAWLGWSPTTLAVAAASLTRTRRCVYNSWAPDDGRRNCSKHVEYWQ